MESLPRELIVSIALRLPLRAVARLMRVSKTVNKYLSSDELWKALFSRIGVRPDLLPALPVKLSYLVLSRLRSLVSDSKHPMIIRKNAWRGSICCASLSMTPVDKELTFEYSYRDTFTSDYGDDSGNWNNCKGTVTASVRPRVASDPVFEFPAIPQGSVLELHFCATSGQHGDFESGYPDDVRGSLAGKSSRMLVSGASVAQKLSSGWHGMPDMFVTK